LYQDIVISVSDGNTTVELAPFSIMVNNAAMVTTGTVDLSWVTPTTRTDGTPLTLSEIDGYRIYMGDTSNDLVMIVDLNDRTITRYTMTNLTSGTHYFAVTTYDNDGNESSFSNIAGKSIM
jgi:fibronectin type 3 domain-containing protein